MESRYKSLSLNVAGLTNLIKRKRVEFLLKKERVYFVCLQEMHEGGGRKMAEANL